MINLIYWAIFGIAAAILLLLWWIHVWAIMRDITREDAREMADALFDDYVQHCEYRVHIRTRIVDEMQPRNPRKGAKSA